VCSARARRPRRRRRGRGRGRRLLAGDPVLVAVETSVVRHGEPVERRASPEGRHRSPGGLVSRTNPADAVRVHLVQVRAVLVQPRHPSGARAPIPTTRSTICRDRSSAQPASCEGGGIRRTRHRPFVHKAHLDAHERTAAIVGAYEILGDAEQRACYDGGPRTFMDDVDVGEWLAERMRVWQTTECLRCGKALYDYTHHRPPGQRTPLQSPPTGPALLARMPAGRPPTRRGKSTAADAARRDVEP
jgi:hypothetical protein